MSDTRRRKTSRSPSAAWPTVLRADRALLERALDGRRVRTSSLSAAAPRLADSRYVAELDAALAKLPRDVIENDAGLALAAGRRAVARDELAEGIGWLVRAQSTVGRAAPGLIARIAFLLGGAYVTRSELAPADAVLAWAEGLLRGRAASSADVLHLRALIEEVRGARGTSLALYRRAIQTAPAALTPLTRVLALRNLAEALAHSDPRESVALYGLALAVIDADDLDDTLRCAIANTMGYALLCSGDVEGARLKLHQALEEARRVTRLRVELYARFNLSIVDELGGESAEAEAKLRAVRAGAASREVGDLALWADVRLAWLAARSGDAQHSRAILRGTFPGAVPVAYREAVATLRALLDLEGARATAARRDLSTLSRSYLARGDELTAFALILWSARADARAGRVAAARRAIAQACAIGSRRGFRLATNWWTGDLVETTLRYAPVEFAEYAETLIAPPPGPRTSLPPRAVRLDVDGAVSVDGSPLDPGVWKSGRTGSGVLQRFFRALLAAHPAALGRDEIADLLWPDSEGDKAVRNLYAATNDLRRVLAVVPGVSLAVVEQRYRLNLDPAVRLV